MSAVGLDSGTVYQDGDIMTPSCFEKMKGEVLHLLGQPESVVVPVRKKSKPHFRILSSAPQAKRVGKSEDSDPTHKKVINHLSKLFAARHQLQITTYVFGGEKREEQIIFKNHDSTKSQASQVEPRKWWTEARIPLDASRYIQPDLCGRSNTNFMPLKSEKSVIIEVIQSHYPDAETFHALTVLSSRNFLVLFYFVEKEGWGSGFSRFSTPALGLVSIRCTYWLSDGEFFKNGERVERHNENDDAWYLRISTRYFDSAKKKKDEKSVTKKPPANPVP